MCNIHPWGGDPCVGCKAYEDGRKAELEQARVIASELMQTQETVNEIIQDLSELSKDGGGR